MYALTGIDWNEMEDVLKHGIKTFELVCADHITIAQKIKPNDELFIINLSKQDAEKGVEGIIVKVKSVRVEYWRTEPREFDEKEILAARIQVKFSAHGRIKSSKNLGDGKGIQVEAERHILLG